VEDQPVPKTPPLTPEQSVGPHPLKHLANRFENDRGWRCGSDGLRTLTRTAVRVMRPHIRGHWIAPGSTPQDAKPLGQQFAAHRKGLPLQPSADARIFEQVRPFLLDEQVFIGQRFCSDGGQYL